MRPLPVAVAAFALVSAALGASTLLPRLHEIHQRWAGATAREALRAPARRYEIPPEPFEFFAERTGAGDRYYVHVPQGARVTLSDEAGVARMYAAYALLPAVQVADPREATVVVALRADPEELELEYVRVDRFAGAVRAAVAWVAR